MLLEVFNEHWLKLWASRRTPDVSRCRRCWFLRRLSLFLHVSISNDVWCGCPWCFILWTWSRKAWCCCLLFRWHLDFILRIITSDSCKWGHSCSGTVTWQNWLTLWRGAVWRWHSCSWVRPHIAVWSLAWHGARASRLAWTQMTQCHCRWGRSGSTQHSEQHSCYSEYSSYLGRGSMAFWPHLKKLQAMPSKSQ